MVMSHRRERVGTPDALQDERRRITYLMFFRVIVVTLLLGAIFASELGSDKLDVMAPLERAMLSLIAATYSLTIIYAVLLKRKGPLRPLAVMQLALDLLTTTVVVHLTGGAESGFVFMYLLVVVAASLVFGRGAVVAAAVASLLYCAVSLLGWSGLWPSPFVPAGSQIQIPLRTLLRVLSVNTVALFATGMLAARLSVELGRASEQMATRLRDLAALHQDVVRCLTSGLITIVDDGRIVTYNSAAEEILGKKSENVVGRTIQEVVPEFMPLLNSLAKDASLRRGEMELRAANGVERNLGISLSPLLDSDGKILGRIIIFQDLTDMRQMEVTVRRAEHLAAIGRLVAGIAHEIRNPLAAISGSIELLHRTTSKEGDSRELMEIVLREVQRLDGLIHDLLDYAKPKRSEQQRIDLSSATGEMLRVFENDKRLQGVEVKLSAEQPIWLEADLSQLHQVLWNLLLNAIEASPPASPVSIEVKQDSYAGQRWARLAVIDCGPGISPEVAAKIFEPFFSTKVTGTDLGMATVHRIVEEHKGSISFEKPASGGSAVVVRLPLSAGPSAVV